MALTGQSVSSFALHPLARIRQRALKRWTCHRRKFRGPIFLPAKAPQHIGTPVRRTGRILQKGQVIMQTTIPSGALEILSGRLIASFGTENDDGSIHLTAV